MWWLLLITSFLLERLPQLCAPTPSQELRSAAQPADSQVLLLSLLEYRSDIGFPSSHRILFWWPQSFKDCFPKLYLNDISQFDEPSWICLMRSCELAGIQLISMSLLSVCLNGGLFIPSDFPSGFRGSVSWKEILLVKNDANKALSTWAVSMPCHQIRWPISFCNRSTFSLIFL